MLLFIVLFLGITSGKGASFLSGGGGGWVPHGGISFDGEVQKNLLDGWGIPHASPPMGNSWG